MEQYRDYHKDLIKNYLTSQDVDWGETGVDVIESDNWENKFSLNQLLSKHPNWNEKERRVELDFKQDIGYDITRHCCFMSWLTEQNNRYDYGIPDEVIDFLKNIDEKDFANVSESDFTMLKEYGFKPRNNTPTNKFMNAVCTKYGVDKSEEYSEEYRIYSEACGAKPKEQKLYLTTAPVDFLSMANGDSWSSCYSLNSSGGYNGMHREGTLMYALDDVSFIVQIVDEKDDEEDKRVRPINKRMHGAYYEGTFLTSLVYPNVDDKRLSNQLRSIVQDIFAKCLGEDSLWIKLTESKRTDMFRFDHMDDIGYPDWIQNESPLPRASILKRLYKEEAEDCVHKRVFVGHLPVCVYCGNDYESSYTLFCPDCR